MVARVVMQPQALHWTSALSVPRRMMRGWRAPAWTMVVLFRASEEETPESHLFMLKIPYYKHAPPNAVVQG